MLLLSDAIPRDTIAAMFQQVREEVTAANGFEFTRRKPNDTAGVCLYIWDQMVHDGKAPDPRKFASVYPEKPDRVYSFVKRELRADPMPDAYAAKFYNEHSEETPG